MPLTVSPLLDYDTALRTILDAVGPLPTERVGLEQSLGRVLREDVRADRDLPPFNRSAMDGYAVAAGAIKPGVTLKVVGRIHAGQAMPASQQTMGHDQTYYIATGSPLPAGANAVIPIEQSVIDNSTSPPHVRFNIDSMDSWRNVHRHASDAKAGQVVLTTGTRLTSSCVGIAAAVGAVNLQVTRLPRIVILTTGDELVAPEVATRELQPQQIRNSNGPMLQAMLTALGTPALQCLHLQDDKAVTLRAARAALDRADLVLTTGGVSAGEKDYLPEAWRELGLHVLVKGVAIQPGRPLLAACENNSGGASEAKLVLGLPGNPVSVLATAHLFAWPVILKMLGMRADRAGLPWRIVRLTEPVTALSKRQVFRAARLVDADHAQVIHWHGSGDLVHTADAHGFVRLPLTDELVPTGTLVPFLPFV